MSSLKQAIILWVSAALTSFLIVGIFWTVFRNELDAARSLVEKADATFTQVESAMREVREASAEFKAEAKRIRMPYKMLSNIYDKTDEVVPRLREAVEKANRATVDGVAELRSQINEFQITTEVHHKEMHKENQKRMNRLLEEELAVRKRIEESLN